MDSNEYSEKKEYKPEKRSRFLDDGKTLAIEARWNTPGMNPTMVILITC